MMRKLYGKQYRREKVELVLTEEAMHLKIKAFLDGMVDFAFGKREKVAV